MPPRTAEDWNDAWKREQASRRPPDDSAYWDKRAPSFQKTAGTSPYARTFAQWMKIADGERVFDMGCGSGTLALPLARAGHEVWAADFSPVMLDLMMQRAELDGVDTLIHPIKLSWEDDWAQADIPTCDIAVASRSAATSDLLAALNKLDGIARRRVCMTLGTNESPRTDDVITKALGRQTLDTPDFVYAMNILWALGKRPALDYIVSTRPDTYSSPEEAIEKFALIYNATPDERSRLEAYVSEHMFEVESQDSQTVWKFDHERKTCWAFIAWDKEQG